MDEGTRKFGSALPVSDICTALSNLHRDKCVKFLNDINLYVMKSWENKSGFGFRRIKNAEVHLGLRNPYF